MSNFTAKLSQTATVVSFCQSMTWANRNYNRYSWITYTSTLSAVIFRTKSRRVGSSLTLCQLRESIFISLPRNFPQEGELSILRAGGDQSRWSWGRSTTRDKKFVLYQFNGRAPKAPPPRLPLARIPYTFFNKPCAMLSCRLCPRCRSPWTQDRGKRHRWGSTKRGFVATRRD